MRRSIWARPEARPGRGRPAELTREQITAAAIAVADAEGLAAVTMRRVGAELATGPASLYRHIATRDDLLDLMVDRALADADPALGTGDWRADIVTAQLGWLRHLRRRPWLLDGLLARPPFGPSALRLIEENLRLIAPCPASGPEKMEALTALGGFVFTLAQQDRSRGAISDQEQFAAQVDLLQRAVVDGAHPHLAAALADPDPRSGESPDGRLARLLRQVLDGLLPQN